MYNRAADDEVPIDELAGRGSIFSYEHYGPPIEARRHCLSLQERLLISSETQAVLDAERREDANVKAILEQEVCSPAYLHVRPNMMDFVGNYRKGIMPLTLPLPSWYILANGTVHSTTFRQGNCFTFRLAHRWCSSWRPRWGGPGSAGGERGRPTWRSLLTAGRW